MTNPALPVQAAVYAAVNAALQSLSPAVPVYDYVPDNFPLPFARVGDGSAVNDDTKVENGHEHSIEIQIYSQHRGTAEVRSIGTAVYDALHNVALSVAGFNASYASMQFEDYFSEPEGSRGVMRFRIKTES